MVPGFIAEVTARPVVKFAAGDIFRTDAKALNDFFVGHVGGFALLADGTHKPLSKHTFQRGRDQVGSHAHIDQTRDRSGGIVGMQRTEDKVPRQRCLNRYGCGLQVPDFTDHHDVRVLSKEGAQHPGKGISGALIDRNLDDAFDIIFDRFLCRQQLALNRVDFTQPRVECRGFSRTGGPRDHDNAIRFFNIDHEGVVDIVRHADCFQVQRHHAAVQDTQHHAFSKLGGKCGHTQVDNATAHAQRYTAVLRKAAFGNVQSGHDLDTRGNRCRQAPRRRRHFV